MNQDQAQKYLTDIITDYVTQLEQLGHPTAARSVLSGAKAALSEVGAQSGKGAPNETQAQ